MTKLKLKRLPDTLYMQLMQQVMQWFLISAL